MVKSRTGDHHMSDLFAFCGIICKRGWQSNHGNISFLKLEKGGGAPSASASILRSSLAAAIPLPGAASSAHKA